MHARPLDVLHDTRDQDICAVADRVHLQLLALQVFVHQNRVILLITVDHRHKLFDLLIGDGDLHPLSAKHIGWTHQHRIAQPVCHLFRLLGSIDRAARRPRDLSLLQNPVKKLPVLRGVHILRLCPKNRHAHLHQALRQLDGRLASKLHHRAVGLLHIDNILYILRGQRLKVELVRNVKIGTHRLRVVVDDNGLIPFSGKRPGSVHGAVVELNPLSDTDGSGT